ncbi:hypothetical protein X975_09701, partial [Stegodyphus mimosarum]
IRGSLYKAFDCLQVLSINITLEKGRTLCSSSPHPTRADDF